MPNNENVGASFSIDITALKAGLAQANRLIRESESEFKAAAAGMDDWASSQDGLTARIKHLTNAQDLQKKKIEALKQQYQEQIEKGIDPMSAAMVKLRTDINKEEEALNKTEKELRNQTRALDDLQNAADDAQDEINNLNDALEDTENATDNASGGFTILKGALADLAADGIKSAVSGIKDLIFEADEASASFQAMTGVSTDEMGKFNDVMNDLYKNNYGESMQDLAEAMAAVAQSSKETDPSKIEELTKNAIVLKDTFGFEYAETMRAVNMLMEQFGVTGEEAYNLIVQGAQNGLNKNDDLLDTINEYSVHYKQLGFTSDEFFNSLANGAADGTFSIDKLGDAFKEFGIRSRDTAKATTEGFELIGLNADEMRKAFAAGGESAKAATEKTVNALFSLNDEVARNQAGVDLFGTMWEDLGESAIKSIMSTNGEISKTTDALKEIDNVRYSGLSSQIAAVGRQIKTGLSEAIQKDALPKLKSFVAEFSKGDSVEKFTSGLLNLGNKVLPPLGKALQFVGEHIESVTTAVFALATAFATLKAISAVTTAITAATTAVGALAAGTGVATTAMTGFNAVMAANPIGVVLTAVGLLTAGILLLCDSEEEAAEKTDLLSESQREAVTAAQEQAEAYKETKAAADELASSEIANVDYVANNLIPQLQMIVDENGNVQQGYEDRANFILNELNTALGTEYTQLNEIIGANGEVKQSIYDVIEAKKAQILLSAYEESYKEAVQNVAAAEKARATQAQELAAQQTVYDEAYKQAKDARIELDNKVANAKTESDLRALASEAQTVAGLEAEAEKQKGILDNKKAEYDKSEAALYGYYQDINNYQTASTLVMSGETNKAVSYLNNMGNGFQTAASVAQKSASEQKAILKQQVIDTEVNARLMKESYEQGVEGVTEEMVATAEEQANQAKAEFVKVGGNLTDGIAQGAEDNQWTLTGAMERIVNNAVEAARKAGIIKSPSRKMRDKVGKELAAGVAVGIDEGTDDAVKKSEEMANKIVSAAQKTLDNYKVYNYLSPDEEADYWNNVRTQVKEGTQARINADKKYFDALAKAETEFLSQSQKDLDNWKVYHEVSLEDEVQYWDDVRNLIQEGTQARIDADKKYFEAVKKYEQEQEKTEEEHKTNIEKTQKSLTQDLLKIQNDYTKKLEAINKKRVKAEETYNNKIKAINKNTLDEISNLRSKYESELSSRQDSLFNAFDLFDTAEFDESKTGQEMTAALQSQVDALKTYSDEINKLKKRGINSNLLAELQDKGVSATGYIQSLNSMSNEELNQYNALYNQKKSIAEKQAKTELTDLSRDTEKQIKAIRKAAAEQKKELKAELDEDIKLISGEYQDTVTEMISETAKAGEKYIENYNELGVNLIDGMIKGFDDNSWKFSDAVTNSVLDAVKAAKEAAGIHSPSKLFRDEIGVNLGLGVVEGVKSTTSKLVGAVKNQINTVKQAYDLDAINNKLNDSNGGNNSANNGGNVVINQTNNYSQAHSRYEIYKSKQQTAAAVRLAMGV